MLIVVGVRLESVVVSRLWMVVMVLVVVLSRRMQLQEVALLSISGGCR